MSDEVFTLPDLGEGLTEATIVEWRVNVGDAVAIDQIVVEVETAKAIVEVPIPFAGTVAKLHAEPGTTHLVGAPLVTVAIAAAKLPEGRGAADHGHGAQDGAERDHILVGFGATASAPGRRPRGKAPALIHSVSVPAPEHRDDVVPVISPVVRALARDYGVDLTDIAVSADRKAITRADVERAVVQSSAGAIPASPNMSDKTVTISGFRKAVADKLSTSRREIPDATTWVDVDASALIDARNTINAVVADDQKVSLLALLARLAVVALRSYPELNSSVDTQRNEITYHAQVQLGVATQTSRGLMVPVIRGACAMTTVELARVLQETTALARDGKLGPERLSGGTFTLDNYGVFGVDGSTPIINHPEAAILGIGRIVDKPWVCDGVLAVRKVTQISLSFDHRVCDGATAGGYLRLFADLVENPVAALGRI